LNLKSEDKISTNDISKVTYESMVLFKRWKESIVKRYFLKVDFSTFYFL
jgi:hypothetical protein